MISMRTASMRRLPAGPALVLLPILLVTLGCSTFLPSSSGARSAEPPTDPIHAQARDALARWADAVTKSGGATISFVGDLTGQLGDWDAAVADNNEPALAAGVLSAPTELSDTKPGRSRVRWLDGKTVDVDVLSAADALDDLIAAAEGSPCDDCLPLRVIDANQATGLVETSQGPAEAPLWVFTIEGTDVRVTRNAVDPSVTVVPPPFNADHPPEGVSINWATGTPGSRKLTVSFAGFEKPGDKPCGADYTAEAVESDLAVVVIVVERLNPISSDCPGGGKTRTASVTLDAPLGARAVLEIRQGLPVPVRAP
jgi:hypothetical protein